MRCVKTKPAGDDLHPQESQVGCPLVQLPLHAELAVHAELPHQFVLPQDLLRLSWLNLFGITSLLHEK